MNLFGIGSSNHRINVSTDLSHEYGGSAIIVECDVGCMFLTPLIRCMELWN